MSYDLFYESPLITIVMLFGNFGGQLGKNIWTFLKNKKNFFFLIFYFLKKRPFHGNLFAKSGRNSRAHHSGDPILLFEVVQEEVKRV